MLISLILLLYTGCSQNASEVNKLSDEERMEWCFSMFGSRCNPYNIVNSTPFRRDVLKEPAKEYRKQGIRFGFYYSQAQDWHYPGGMGNNRDESIVPVRDTSLISKLFFVLQNPTFFSVGFAA
jgi:hypothetical protein